MAATLRATLLRCLALAGLALAAALLANALASPARRLAWTGTVAPLPVLPPHSGQPSPLTAVAPSSALLESKPLPPSRPAPDMNEGGPPGRFAPSTSPLVLPHVVARQNPATTSPATPVMTVARPAEPVPPQASADASPIREISGPEAWVAFQGKAPFLDARRSAEFTEGHIAGAWCAPVWEAGLDDRLIFFKAARRPGPKDPIVIYCSGGDCHDSHLLAAKLLKEGYYHLLIYRDGYPDWLALGHPVEKGRP